MKNSLIITFVLLNYSLLTFSQENSDLNLLIADTTWFKETTKFPIGFAQEIPYKGFADLRFAPGFTDAKSPELWSYVWAWQLNNKETLTANEIENNLELYFNGLLGLHPTANKVEHSSTLALVLMKEKIDDTLIFIGKIKTFDTRYTNEPLLLNVKIEAHFCREEKRCFVVFRLSPKDFMHEVWQKLNSIKLQKPLCNN